MGGNNDIQHLENRIEKKKGEVENKRDKMEDLEETIQELQKMKSRKNTGSRAVDAVLSMNNDRIIGAFQDLISTESRFAVAIETAGGHMNDVVVEDKDTAAVNAINYLKKRKYRPCKNVASGQKILYAISPQNQGWRKRKRCYRLCR